MSRYWAGPWIWVAATADVEDHYAPPSGASGTIDFRTAAECGTPGVAFSGQGLFVTADSANLGSRYLNLGTNLEGNLNTTQRNNLQSRLRLPNAFVARTLADCIYEAHTVQADPTFVNRAGPLIPMIDRELELWIDNQKVRSSRFDPATSPEAPVLQQALQLRYERLRTQCLQRGDTTLYRKYLDSLEHKYFRTRGENYRWFQSERVPDEEPIARTTTITDNFNRANANPLSNSAEGWAWTQTSSAIQLVSNQATTTGNGQDWARAEVDLSSDDHYVQVVSHAHSATNPTYYVYVLARYSTSAVTFYYAKIAGDGSFRFTKAVTGTFTDLGTPSSETLSLPDTIRLECDGSTLRRYFNGTLRETLSGETSIDSNLRTGLILNQGGGVATIADDFEAGDLAAGGDPEGSLLAGKLVRGGLLKGGVLVR